MLLANFNFGDGYIGSANGKDKRLQNWIEVSQLGRLAKDVSISNDRYLDSRTLGVTLTDGRKAKANLGVF